MALIITHWCSLNIIPKLIEEINAVLFPVLIGFTACNKLLFIILLPLVSAIGLGSGLNE